jgi:hypothetical protein
VPQQQQQQQQEEEVALLQRHPLQLSRQQQRELRQVLLL